MKILVTGGAGFIGSHLVDHLMSMGYEVRAFDNLSAGKLSNLAQWSEDTNFQFFEGDLLDLSSIKSALDGCTAVYHLAANPEVRSYKASPMDHFTQNIKGTFNLLEAIRENGEIQFLGFTSTSTVYGEPSIIPTSETYAPLKPISNYGASKLAAEAMICSYSAMFNFRAAIFRLANVIGPRSDHGVIYDFINKLNANPAELEILGDGSQSKSYLYIDDCIIGMLTSLQSFDQQVDIFNIGSDDRMIVMKISETVIDEMKLSNVAIRTTGGVDGGRGWKGDVKIMQLDMSNLKKHGWKPKYNSEEAVRLTARHLVSS